MIRFSKIHAFALVAAVGLGSALMTTAQPPEGDRERRSDRAQRLIDRFDENGDGKIEESEVPENMWRRLGDLDTNGDGAITADELNAAGGNDRRGRGRRGGGQLMRALDTDKDGKLSKAEIAAASTALLTLDKDENGELSAEELRGQRNSRERGERGERRGGRGGDDEGHGAGRGQEKEL